MEDLGKLIKFARNKQKMTQKELAEQMGVSINTIFRWEHSQGCPNAEEVVKLSHVLNYKFFKDYDLNEDVDLESIDNKLEVIKVKIDSSRDIKIKVLSTLVFVLSISCLIIIFLFIMFYQAINWRSPDTSEEPVKIIEYVMEDED